MGKAGIIALRAGLFACLCLLGACAPRVELPRMEGSEEAFAAFRARFAEPGHDGAGLYARTSVLYSTPERSNRTDVQLWGDFDRPLRLDVRAGLGTVLALLREDKAGLLAYYPDKRKAYAHSDPVIGAQLLGMPFPFALRDLAHLVSGDFATLVGAEFEATRVIPRGKGGSGGGFEYRFRQGPVETLRLDPYGRPERMTGRLSKHFRTQAEREGAPVAGERVWSIDFSAYPEDDGDPQGAANILTLTLPRGESAVLRVRTVEPKAHRWAEKALALPLPEGTEYMALDRQAAPPAGETDVITGGGAHERGDSGAGARPGV